MSETTTNKTVQYFVSSNTEDHIFSRPVSGLLVTFSGTNNMSLDGTNFMPMTAGTYQFTNLGFVKHVYFTGSGTRTGYGFAL